MTMSTGSGIPQVRSRARRRALGLAHLLALALAALISGLAFAGCGGDDGVAPTENCSAVGDEDEDGDADCADSDCAATPACVAALCGNGMTNAGEACDDGNEIDTDACTNACAAARCGDGIMGPGEACDDGNMVDNDACTNMCRAPSCGDGIMQAGEQCDDGNMVDTDACLNTCMTARCGDGVIRAGTEMCDDGGTANGNGCSATCTVEAGFMCAMTPSVCTTTCGDGIIAGMETCDQGGGNVANGDGCSAMCRVEAGFMCNGMPSICSNSCGNGTVQPGEQCDDGNMVAGDGCANNCTFDIGCAAGETQIAVTNAMAMPIPDNLPAGVTSTVMVMSAQVVSKLAVVLDITHPFDGDVDVSLTGPRMITRDLSSDNGGAGMNYTRTMFDDSAATSVVTGTAPFTGRFRPEQSLGFNGFRGQLAGGTWTLTVVDDAATDVGTLNTWTLITCTSLVVPRCGNTMVEAGEECDDGNDVANDACSNTCGVTMGCGNGIVDAGEDCDDDNRTSGDGCSATCGVEIVCPVGQTAVVVANTTMAAIPDNDLVTGVSSTAMVATMGAVTSVKVFIGSLTHTNDADLDIFLESPAAIRRELSTDNGGTGDNYASTMFDDAAATSITAGVVPFTGSFRPELSLSATAGTDFRRLRANGTWTLRVFDDLATNTGTLNNWKLLMCVDPAASFCGDSMVDAGEECDDGNTVNGDACSNLCQISDGCGDGNIDAGEACDDNNVTAGDGCSATCMLDIGCAAGQTPMIVSNNVVTPIPDSNIAGVLSTITVPTAGLVRRTIVTVNVTHPVDGDVDMYLMSPRGGQRILSDDQSGVNYTRTIFSDSAATAITSGAAGGAVAPYTGSFKPENSLDVYNNQAAAGDWLLRVADDTTGSTGSLDSWTVALCIDQSAPRVCGNGIVEATETCDDGNIVAADGCSAMCQLELSCAVGQVPMVVTSADAKLLMADSTPAGVTSTIAVAGAGTVAKAFVLINALGHTFDADVDMTLIAPNAMTVDLSTDNGSSGDDFMGTIFADAATRLISAEEFNSAAPPFRGMWKPEGMLSTVNGQPAAGTWNLKLVDDAAGDSGALRTWSIGICLQP